MHLPRPLPRRQRRTIPRVRAVNTHRRIRPAKRLDGSLPLSAEASAKADDTCHLTPDTSLRNKPNSPEQALLQGLEALGIPVPEGYGQGERQ